MIPRRAALGLVLALIPAVSSAESFASWSARAEKALREKKPAAAIAAYGNALDLWTPADGVRAKALALAARAELHDRADPAAALRDLDAAILLQPKDPALRDRRGRVHMRRGAAAKAADDFYRAVSLKLDYAEAYFDRAQAYELLGDKAFAAEDYRTACKLGYKKACRYASAAAPAAKPRAPAGRAKKRAPAARPVDLDACRDRLQACADAGKSYAECVSSALLCDELAAAGCCPRACADRFRRALETANSEAAAFREAFSSEAGCAASGPPKAEKK